MGSFGKASHSIFAMLRTLGCVLALGMAIVLPALRTRHYGPSYKPVEVRQTAARHEYLGLSEDRSDAGEKSITAFSGPAPLSLFDPTPAAADAWRAATLLMPKPTAPRYFRRLKISSDPCGPPFSRARLAT
ncbi:MAG: hypothetical protein WA740_08480 [Candidatus Binataceae bacterium]